jgi:hypothetical protein
MTSKKKKIEIIGEDSDISVLYGASIEEKEDDVFWKLSCRQRKLLALYKRLIAFFADEA